MSLLLVLAGCSPTPTITSVTPDEALPGAELQIFGEALPPTADWALVSGTKTVSLGTLPSEGGLVVRAVVPEGVTAGAWAVQVSTDRGISTLEPGLTVPTVAEERPCATGWTLRSEVSRTRKEVAIDRLGPDDFRETTRLPFSDVARIEYELRRLDDETLCSSIYVKGSNGQRWPIDEARDVNLAARAFRIGNTVGRPTEVTHADIDVSDDPRPGARN